MKSRTRTKNSPTSQGVTKSTKTPQSGTKNSPTSQGVSKRSTTPQSGTKNSPTSKGVTKSTKTPQSGSKNSPPSQGGVPEGGGGCNKTPPTSNTEPSGGFNSNNLTPEQVRNGGYRLNNLPHLKTFRKELRNNLTPAEAKLWTLLKEKALDGRKFRRQHSFANYILDFYCPKERLAIELDGQGHFEATQAEYDQERDLFLEAFGIKVLRFENKWVWNNAKGLLDEVRSHFGKQPPRPSDTPPYKKGEL